jgi:hypothetical protein
MFAVLLDFQYTTFKTPSSAPFQLVISASIARKYLLTSELKPARGHKVWAIRQLPFYRTAGGNAREMGCSSYFWTVINRLTVPVLRQIRGEQAHK